ncbi:MAG: TonB-dependent receptor [Sphingobacteriales bacterium]
MKFRLIIIVLLFISASSFSQKTLKGNVVDATTNMPLAGATISFAGKGGTTTDKEGNFSVDCDKVKSFTVSYISYESYKVTIKNCDEELTIKLQHSVSYLEEVEITATSNLDKSVLYQPASITKLTPTELKRGTGLFLDDAIQTNVTGVIMNRRSFAGGQQFNIRGYGNGTRGTRGISSNFDGQGYKVYLNGIPVTDAEGITTMDDIDFGSIGNVEVTKGPAGTLYGLAIAGAVNLSTIKPEKNKTSVGQEVLLGNYGLQRYNTQLQTAGEHSSWLLNYGHQESDGVSIHNQSRKNFVNVTGEFNPTDKQNITTYFGYSNSYDERFGELTIAQYESGDYSGNPDYIKRNGHSNVITFRAGVNHTYNFNKIISNTTTVFGTGFTSNASSAAGWTDKSTINYGLRSVFTTKFSLAKDINLSGLTGVETQRQDAQVVGYNMKTDPNDPNPNTYVYGISPYWIINANTSNVAYVSKTTSLFTEWTLSLPKDFSVTAGLGISSMNLSLNDRFNPAISTRPNQYDKSYNGLVSPHVAINKVFNKDFSVYASYSKAYKAPTSSYFFITTPAVTTPATPATGRVNDNLKSEAGNQFEIGTKGQLFHDKLVYELAYFHAEFSNKMTSIPVVSPANPNSTLYSYVVNGGTQIHNGVEALLKYTVYESSNKFFQSVRPFVNLTYSDFKYGDNFIFRRGFAKGDTLDYSNKMVAGVPKWAANIGVDVNMNYGLYFNLTYNYRDKLAITSLNDSYATSYALLNGKIGVRHDLGKHFTVDAYFGATNITSTKYYYMVFVNQIPDAYLPAARNALVFGGVNLKYTF